MKAILVDDEQTNLENLQFLIERHCPSVEIIAKANTIETAAAFIKVQQPDLLFLDIQMGRDSGFDLLRKVNEQSFEIIFVTAHDQYGIQAIKFAALDYLLKPVNPEELQLAVRKAEHKMNHKRESGQLNFLLQQLRKTEPVIPKIALPQQHEIRYVMIQDICRCRADNTYTFFHLSDAEEILTSKPLKEYAELLKTHGFIRVHQTHLINPAYVKSWLKEDGGMLLMLNGDKIPVSKPNRERVKNTLGK